MAGSSGALYAHVCKVTAIWCYAQAHAIGWVRLLHKSIHRINWEIIIEWREHKFFAINFSCTVKKFTTIEGYCCNNVTWKGINRLMEWMQAPWRYILSICFIVVCKGRLSSRSVPYHKAHAIANIVCWAVPRAWHRPCFFPLHIVPCSFPGCQFNCERSRKTEWLKQSQRCTSKTKDLGLACA